MNKKTLWSLIALAIIIIILVWTSKIQPKQPIVVTPAPEENKTENKSVVFVDQATGEKVPADFTNESVTFTNNNLGTMTLPHVISESGSRYANSDESIVFWNKGDSVFITQNGKIVFNGSISESSENSNDSKPTVDNSEHSFLQSTVWIWQSIQLNNELIKPNKPGVFTLTFNKDGNINGTTDCNGFFGDYKTYNNNSIEIGPLASTLMYCENSQEKIFRDAVEKSISYKKNQKGDLVLFLPDNAGSILFKKK